jgi:hypothetical protein
VALGGEACPREPCGAWALGRRSRENGAGPRGRGGGKFREGVV